jgi:hypothetical protein
MLDLPRCGVGLRTAFLRGQRNLIGRLAAVCLGQKRALLRDGKLPLSGNRHDLGVDGSGFIEDSSTAAMSDTTLDCKFQKEGVPRHIDTQG